MKIWRDGFDGMKVDQQFGQTDLSRFGGQKQQKFVFKTNNQVKSGGLVDTQTILGPLLAGAWDPRDNSCLMMLGSFQGKIAVCDVWRNSVYVTFPDHGGQVQDIKWTRYPCCLACSVSTDGTARVY